MNTNPTNPINPAETQAPAAPINLLAVSIGNTHTRIGAFVQGKPQPPLILPNDQLGQPSDAQLEKLFKPLADKDDPVVLLASVNPELAPKATDWLNKKLGVQTHRIETDVNVPIGRQLDPESLVGEDRLLNAAAAYDVLKQACVVVDAGTAITVDFIDGNGTFHGGAIGPGAEMMLQSLHEHTAQLPTVTLARPAEPIGHNTLEAIRTGVYHALRGMVHTLVEQYAEQAGAYPMVIATGGDAKLLFEDDELIDRIVPDLTLQGLAVTLRAAIQEPDD